MARRPTASSFAPNEEARGIERRRLLVLGGVAAATFLVACGSGDEDGGGVQPAAGQFRAGNLADFPEGSVTRIDDGAFLVLHDAGGFYAMTAVCTHQGCTVEVAQQDLPCPCHGSVFDLEGNVVTGPAVAPLDHLQLTIEADGSVLVDTSVTVAPGTRAAP
ncbi:MAG: Rieske (2Fe-2S) protein [Deltaproteobacteria bacterium]|nr:Rieske (2Fe-2S) protein [Deltaproteobacteria bacterium]MBW2535349.1 Rieske (2Fe-2S) protein [Deltaproteobacteria bacterium]